MAEGDTILRLARRLDAALAGELIAVAAPNSRGRAAGVERLDGTRFDGAESRGKHLLLHFGKFVLHSHLGMSGCWHLYRRNEPWRRPHSLAWAVLAGDDSEAVQFGGPTLRVMRNEQLRRDPQLSRLGPDVLGPDFDPAPVVAAMRAEPGRAVGEALLDQSAVAGIGNVFKSEACFAARVDPWRAVGDLGDEELAAVIEAARTQMLSAVASGRHNPAVHRRRGPCPRCGAPISSRGQGDANRTTYWCPGCQR